MLPLPKFTPQEERDLTTLRGTYCRALEAGHRTTRERLLAAFVAVNKRRPSLYVECEFLDGDDGDDI